MSQQINLYNPEFEHKRKPFGAAAMAQALLLLVAGVLALSYYGERHVVALQAEADSGAKRLDRKKRELEAVNAEFAPRQKSPELEAELAEAESQLAALQRIAGAVERGDLGNAKGYSEYFRAFARQRVDGVWLTGLAISGAGSEIGVHGRATDPALLTGFLAQLTREKILQGKSFGSLQIGQPTTAAPSAQPALPGQQAKEEKTPPAPYVEFSLQSKQEGARS